MIPENQPNGTRRIRIRRGVLGVIQRGQAVLLIRRALRVTSGGLWCFPGGHVEVGETSRRAVRRELIEELGIQVMPVARVGAVRLATRGYVLAVWRVDYTGDSFSPCADEVAQVGWFEPEQVRSLEDGMPSNERVLELLGL